MQQNVLPNMGNKIMDSSIPTFNAQTSQDHASIQKDQHHKMIRDESLDQFKPSSPKDFKIGSLEEYDEIGKNKRV